MRMITIGFEHARGGKEKKGDDDHDGEIMTIMMT